MSLNQDGNYKSIAVTCLIFGDFPSSKVRGYGRVTERNALEFDWKFINFSRLTNSSMALSESNIYKRIFRKGKTYILTPIKFLCYLPVIKKSDLVYVIKFPPLWVSRLLKLLKVNAVIDFDDPLWLDSFKGTKWFKQTINCYKGYTCDNEIQLNESMKFASSKIQSQVILGHVSISPPKKAVNKKIIWVGSHGTTSYLKNIEVEVDKFLLTNHEFSLDILGASAGDFKFSAQNIRFFPSYNEQEMNDLLNTASIGLFPLLSDELSLMRGMHKYRVYSSKCLISLVSQNELSMKYIQDGIDGIICNSIQDWSLKLNMIASNPNIILTIGQASQNKIIKENSAQIIEGALKNFI